MRRVWMLCVVLCCLPMQAGAAQRFDVSCDNVQSVELVEAQGRWNVVLTLTQQGSDTLHQLTADNVGDVLTIHAGEQQLMAAKVGGPIRMGKIGMAAPTRGQARDIGWQVCPALVQ